MDDIYAHGDVSQSPDPVPVLLPLASAVVVNHLKACQQIAVDHATPLFREFLNALELAFLRKMESVHSNQEANDINQASRLFKQHGAEMERYFCGYIAEAYVKFKKGDLKTSFDGPEEENHGLALVDNIELDETIMLSTICQRADAHFAENIWALNQRLAILNNGRKVTEINNPASPAQFCNALRRAVKLVNIHHSLKLVVYRVFEGKLLTFVERVLTDTNAFLVQNGLLPNLSLVKKHNPVSKRHAVQHVEVDSSAQNQGELLQSIRQLQYQLNSITAEARIEHNDVVSVDELITVLRNVQQKHIAMQSQAGEVKPADIRSLVEELRSSLKKENEDKGLDPRDDQTIDLVGMLFDYMLNDDNLPDSLKAILSYLHTPFLKIAFSDPGFFEQTDHPARELLNNLAEAGARWVSKEGSVQYDMLNKIKQQVDYVLKNFDNDLRTITEAVLNFSQYTKGIIRRQELMEKRALEKAKGEEKLREVKLRVNDEVRERTEDKELPSVVLLFLLQPWSDYLSFCLLRFGDQSRNWKDALAIVDDLAWCVTPQKDRRDAARQLALKELILNAMQNGFDTIGFDKEKGKHLRDSINSLVDLAAEHVKPQPASKEDVSKLRALAAENSGAAEQTALAECSEAERTMIDKLKMIEFGTWFEFHGGRRLKVAWYNKRTSHYMLVDRYGKRAAMVSGLDMAKQLLNGETKLIVGSSKPFFERALENTLKTLNQRVSNYNELRAS